MKVSCVSVIVPLVGMAMNVFAQIVCTRAAPRLGLFRSLLAGFGSGAIVTLFFSYYASIHSGKMGVAGIAGDVMLDGVMYTLLGYCYFHFVNLGETARRIRILREIHDSEAGLTINEIVARYNAGEIFDNRLRRLVEKRQIIMRDGRLYATRSMMYYMTLALIAMKKLILGKKSEFD